MSRFEKTRDRMIESAWVPAVGLLAVLSVLVFAGVYGQYRRALEAQLKLAKIQEEALALQKTALDKIPTPDQLPAPVVSWSLTPEDLEMERWVTEGLPPEPDPADWPPPPVMPEPPFVDLRWIDAPDSGIYWEGVYSKLVVMVKGCDVLGLGQVKSDDSGLPEYLALAPGRYRYFAHGHWWWIEVPE